MIHSFFKREELKISILAILNLRWSWIIQVEMSNRKLDKAQTSALKIHLGEFGHLDINIVGKMCPPRGKI